MLTSLSLRTALIATLMLAGGAQTPAEIAGRWVGSIDTDQGQLEIVLSLTHADGTFTGEVSSAHGGWPVSAVTAKDGTWTVRFGTAEEGGTMTGAIAEGRFRGEWKTHMATGTFDLVRPRRR